LDCGIKISRRNRHGTKTILIAGAACTLSEGQRRKLRYTANRWDAENRKRGCKDMVSALGKPGCGGTE